MDEKDLLLISIGPTRQTALQVEKILQSKGITTTIIDPFFINPRDFALFTEFLATHRYAATFVRGQMGALIDNFLVQNSIREAQTLNFTTPDMWVQFGAKSELDSEIGMTPESMAQKILEEFFAAPKARF